MPLSVKHLNPRQGITTYDPHLVTDLAVRRTCETPKSPPGDYNPSQTRRRLSSRTNAQCETPKSPPGDYNAQRARGGQDGNHGVKHLNPRQGITTLTPAIEREMPRRCGVKHLNPRQGITTVWSPHVGSALQLSSVKHLNPRQGITTRVETGTGFAIAIAAGVKHLNPRQGITTRTPEARFHCHRWRRCETPKSPPGDYNYDFPKRIEPSSLGVKHLNPRQGITTDRRSPTINALRTFRCETPKSPPGDYNHRNRGIFIIPAP